MSNLPFFSNVGWDWDGPEVDAAFPDPRSQLESDSDSANKSDDIIKSETTVFRIQSYYNLNPLYTPLGSGKRRRMTDTIQA